MNAHTPGPWAGVKARTLIHIKGAYGYLVCSASNEDNARLIVAAPDLLEAAREGLRWIEGWMEARQYPETAAEWCEIHDEAIPDTVYAQRDRVRAAIAKAEGRS